MVKTSLLIEYAQKVLFIYFLKEYAEEYGFNSSSEFLNCYARSLEYAMIHWRY